MKKFEYLKKTLKLGDLLNIDKSRVLRSKDLKISSIKLYSTVDDPKSLIKRFLNLIFKNKFKILSRVIKYNITNTKNGRSHFVIIKVPMHIDNNVLSQDVKIYCDCEDFKYRSAWLLNKNDNLFLNKKYEKALGIAITTQPMKLQPEIGCKHVYKAIEDIVDNYKKYLILK